ncbi:MAG TPA: carboxymuconolactone decarboxylase family protein [Longimicrobiales bacterium]|nr:carboxymuconolactone decarboxylase family protein [Longimicrobiales bacterium]
MSLSDFHEFRERMNERVLGAGNLDINRFFALDSRVYADGALPAATKELMGLVASLVLRCDDCITYHMVRCVEEGVRDEDITETMAVGLVVGGSIVIPHLRRAVATLDELRAGAPAPPSAPPSVPPSVPAPAPPGPDRV